MRRLTHHQRSALAYLCRQAEPKTPLQVSFGCNSQACDWSREKLRALADRGLAKPGPADRYGYQTWLITDAGRAALSKPTPTTEDKEREDRA